MKLMVNKAIRK